SGQYLLGDLRDAMNSDEWRSGTVAERRAIFNRLKEAARADARADMGLVNDAPQGYEPVP
ncbi:MAG TPA: hypothetical protein VNT25_04030, partial [Allosphingosinicella sp.]|nr:hypothetical protein [Allosphingosinicella sp.]